MGKRRFPYRVDFNDYKFGLWIGSEDYRKMIDWIHENCGGHRHAYVKETENHSTVKALRFHDESHAVLFKLIWFKDNV